MWVGTIKVDMRPKSDRKIKRPDQNFDLKSLKRPEFFYHLEVKIISFMITFTEYS